MTVYCATTNPGKIREFRLAAQAARVLVEPLPGLSALATPQETGVTFEANASIKAEYYSRAAGADLLFAEDSGLEVDLLNGHPGVYSARFAGEHATDAMNNALLLNRLGGRISPARYVCVIALAVNGVVERTFRGTVEGVILAEERGTGGFGYDPMFQVPALGKTFGEASDDEKMSVSHRSAAAQLLFHYLAAR